MVDYHRFLSQEYPSTHSFLHRQRLPLFPEEVSLSQEAFQSMKQVVSTLFALKQDPDYWKAVGSEAPSNINKNHFQDSVLMAYDFHLDQEGRPRLIEVNTNASGFLLTNAFYQYRGMPYQESLNLLKDSFQKEWFKFQKNQKNNKKTPHKVVLMDQDISQQKMFVEFFMFKDFFKTFDWPLEICEMASLSFKDFQLLTDQGEKIDFIYNRSTDFYFENFPSLLQAYQNQSCCITPHPRDYFLLSDKKRLCLWSLHQNQWPLLKSINPNLVFSQILTSKNQEEAWSNKSKYFFKPLSGYGGKRVYKGAGLTRSKFTEICQGDFLFQEHISPSVWRDSEGEDWKQDFRVFAYENQIQQIVARCYKGQLTNFKEDKSGFALVQIL